MEIQSHNLEKSMLYNFSYWQPESEPPLRHLTTLLSGPLFHHIPPFPATTELWSSFCYLFSFQLYPFLFFSFLMFNHINYVKISFEKNNPIIVHLFWIIYLFFLFSIYSFLIIFTLVFHKYFFFFLLKLVKQQPFFIKTSHRWWIQKIYIRRYHYVTTRARSQSLHYKPYFIL